MAETITRSNQISQIDQLPVMGQSADVKLEAALLAIDQNFDKPLRLYANPAGADHKLYISANKVLSSDGSERSVPAIKKTITAFPASTVDFQGNLTTGGTIDITFPTTTAGQFRRCGFTLISGGILKAVFSDPAATLAATADPGTLFISGGVPAGWVDLESTGTTTYKTAGSLTVCIENSVSGTPTIHRFDTGGGVSSGGGTSGALKPAGGFNVLFTDDFTEFPNSTASKVRDLETNASYDAGHEMYSLLCDKTKQFTTSGTNYTINLAPSFTVAAGDIIYSGGSWRRIATVTSQTTGTLDVAFSPNLAGATGMVSQAVWSTDIVNFGDAAQKTRIRDFYPSASLSQININYDDSLATNDDVADYVDQANVVVSASNDGLQSDTYLPTASTFTTYFARPQAPAQVNNLPLLSNTNKQRLFLVFFCSPVKATVTTSANLLGYRCSLEEKAVLLSGGSLWSSVCWSDSSVTPINCSNPTLVSGKSRITFTNAYVPSIGNPGAGELSVIFNGSSIPRYYTGVKGAYYTEVDPYTIDLWTDVSGLLPEASIVIKRQIGSIDTASSSALRLSAMYDAVVGSAAQVALGIAQYSLFNDARAAIPVGGSILILRGTYTETFVINKQCNVEGQGRGTVLSGTVQLTSTCDYSSISKLKFNGNVTIDAGATGNILTGFWIASGSSVTNNGTDTITVGVSE